MGSRGPRWTGCIGSKPLTVRRSSSTLSAQAQRCAVIHAIRVPVAASQFYRWWNSLTSINLAPRANSCGAPVTRFIAIFWLITFGVVIAPASAQPTGAYLIVELDRETLRWSRLQEIAETVSAALNERQIAIQDTSGIQDGSFFVHLQRAQDRQSALEILAATLPAMGEADARVSSTRDLIRITPGATATRLREEQLISQLTEAVRERLTSPTFGAVTVSAQSDGAIAITASGISDPLLFRRAFGQSFLTLNTVNDDVSREDIAEQRWPVTDRLAQPAREIGRDRAEVVQIEPLLTAEHIVSFTPQEDNLVGELSVGIRFDREGTHEFCEFTRENVRRRIAILDSGNVIVAPMIYEPICGGEAQISGNFNRLSVSEFAARLASGNLPAPIVVSGQGQGLTPTMSGFSAREIAAMDFFEEDWGFERSYPADSWWGGGFRGGDGECGGPKALRILIRQEAAPDGSLEWRLRLNPLQPNGALVTAVDIATGQLTTEFLGEIEVFQRTGDRLTISRGSNRLEFYRCPAN